VLTVLRLSRFVDWYLDVGTRAPVWRLGRQSAAADDLVREMAYWSERVKGSLMRVSWWQRLRKCLGRGP
jgi:hypothetical protein